MIHEVHRMELKELYKIQRAFKNGIKIPVSTEYKNDGLELLNKRTNNKILFVFNNVFSKTIKNIYGWDLSTEQSKYCYIKSTKANTSKADASRFRRAQYMESGTKYLINKYPFSKEQLVFLPPDLEFGTSGTKLDSFVISYINYFVDYKEKDAGITPKNKGEKLDSDLSFLDDLIDGKTDSRETSFYTKTGKPLRVERKLQKNLCQEIELPGYTLNTQKEGKKMNRITQIAGTTMDVNKEAMKLAAKLEVGKIATSQLKKVVKPKLPMMVRGYADSVLFDIVLANAVGIALREYAPGNDKAQIVAEAMIQSAAVEMVSSFNINDMLDEMLSTIDVSKLTNLEKTEE